MVAKAKSDLRRLLATIDFIEHGFTPGHVNRIEGCLFALENHGELDAAGIATHLPPNPRTGEPISDVTLRSYLQPLLERGVDVKRRYVGRPRNRKESYRLTDLYSVNAEDLAKWWQRKSIPRRPPESNLSKQKAELLAGIDWPKHGLTWHRGDQIARVCESVDLAPEMTDDKRASVLGIGSSTLTKLFTICRSCDPKKDGPEDVRLGIIETESGYDHWPRGPSRRRAVWAEIKKLHRRNDEGPPPELRAKRISRRSTPDGRLDRERTLILRSRDLLACDGIETIEQAAVAERILSVVGNGWDQGNQLLAQKVGIAKTTLEKHMRKMQLAKLLGFRPLRRKGTHSPRKEWFGVWETIEQLPKMRVQRGGVPKPKSKRQTEAPANGQAGSNGPAAAKAKKPGKRGPQGEYWHLNAWLIAELSECDGKPYDLRERYKAENPGRPLPKLRSFTALVSKAREKARASRATVSK